MNSPRARQKIWPKSIFRLSSQFYQAGAIEIAHFFDPENFHKVVHRPALGPCWEWKGCRNDNGYGRVAGPQFAVLQYSLGSYSTHRIAFMLNRGRALESTEVVCHHCDNPPCSNPRHLFSGSKQDNNKDRLRKGRAPNIPQKLTAEDVLVIRHWAANRTPGMTVKDFLQTHSFDINVRTFNYIVSRKVWKHI